MKINTRLAWTLAVFLMAVPSAFGQGKSDARKSDARKGELSQQDARHLESMARSDMAEVAAGKLAASKAKSAEVRKFGQHMVDEHTKMLDEGSKLAKSKGVQPPSGPDKKHEAALKKLEGMSGDEFDRAFMKQMVQSHQEALKVVKEAASKASDPELKAMAQKATPKVEEHLKMAREISGGEKSAKGSGSTPKAADASAGRTQVAK